MNKNFTAADIEIFIATYNRAQYLRAAVDSVLAQTAKGFKLTVLDNSSADNTYEVAQEYAPRGVRYAKTEGPVGNFKYARANASAPYVMFFHDDDLLHPQYLERMLAGLNAFENTAVATAVFGWFKDEDAAAVKGKFAAPLANKYLHTADAEYFACGLLSDKYSSCVCSALYRLDAFRSLEWDFEKYGKLNDWPGLTEAAKKGNSFVLADPRAVFCRVHPGRDSADAATAVAEGQMRNWFKYFYGMVFEKHKMFFILEMSRIMPVQCAAFLPPGQRSPASINAFCGGLFEDAGFFLSLLRSVYINRRTNIICRILSLPLKPLLLADIKRRTRKL